MSKAQRSDGKKQKALLDMFCDNPNLYTDGQRLMSLTDENLLPVDGISLQRIRSILCKIPNGDQKVALVDKWITVRDNQSSKKRAAQKSPVQDALGILGVKVKTSPVGTYKALLTFEGGIFACTIGFDTYFYAYKTINLSEMFDVLYPIAVCSDGTSMSKPELNNIISNLDEKPILIFLNASVYQKLYGANTKGKLVFQPQAK
jgi:hypothetical protein